MKHIAIVYLEDQNAPSEPCRELFEVTRETAVEVATKILERQGVEVEDGIVQDSNYGDFQVYADGFYVIFTKLG